MQIVIDIDEEDYNDLTLTGENTIPLSALLRLRESLRNGTPLPKHGRLGDLDKIYVALNEAQIEGTPEYKGIGAAKQMICDAPTIIETESEDKMTTEEIRVMPFDWNDNLSEIAQEDFSLIQKSLSYGTAQTIGLALAKLELLEKQGCKVTGAELSQR